MAGNDSESFQAGQLSRVRSQIKHLMDKAAPLGMHQVIVSAFALVSHKLRTPPAEYGDPLYKTKLPGGVVCHAMEPPVNVHFLLHEESRRVCILDIEPLAGSPLAQD
jgi:hypothetical protein